MAALDVDNGSGVSLAGYAGPSCRTNLLGIMDGMDQNDSLLHCWYFSPRCVPCCRFQARDARHHGRYGPGGQYCAVFSGMCKVGFTADSAPHAVFLSFLSSGPHARLGPYGPDGQLRGEILADMVPMVPTAENCGFPQLQSIKVVDICFVVHTLVPMVLLTIEIPQLRMDTVVDTPLCRTRRSCGFFGCILGEDSREATVATRWSMDDVVACPLCATTGVEQIVASCHRSMKSCG